MKKIAVALTIMIGTFLEGSQLPQASSWKNALGWGAVKGFVQGLVYTATALEAAKIIDSGVCPSKYTTLVGALLNSGLVGLNSARSSIFEVPVQKPASSQSINPFEEAGAKESDGNALHDFPLWAAGVAKCLPSSPVVAESCYEKSAKKELFLFALSGIAALGFGYNGSNPESALRWGLVTNYALKGLDNRLSWLYSK